MCIRDRYLDTPAITVGDNATLSAKLRWRLEDPAGAVIAGSCTDGWDAANVRVSNDGGTTWEEFNSGLKHLGVFSLELSEENRILYAGTRTGGVYWITLDG